MVAEQLKHQRQRGHPKAQNRDADGGGGKGCRLFSNDWRPDTCEAGAGAAGQPCSELRAHRPHVQGVQTWQGAAACPPTAG